MSENPVAKGSGYGKLRGVWFEIGMVIAILIEGPRLVFRFYRALGQYESWAIADFDTRWDLVGGVITVILFPLGLYTCTERIVQSIRNI